jgi:Spy/CpxP family protein refolding chaperone
MRYRNWMALLVAGGVVLAAPLAFAVRGGACGGGPHGRHGDPDARLEKHLAELGLEPAQQERVRAILDAARPEREAARERMRAEFEKMQALLEAEKPDEAAVLAQADAIGALRTERQKAMLRTLLRVRAELTPEQHQKLRELMRKDGPRHWKRRGEAPQDDTL